MRTQPAGQNADQSSPYALALALALALPHRSIFLFWKKIMADPTVKLIFLGNTDASIPLLGANSRSGNGDFD